MSLPPLFSGVNYLPPMITSIPQSARETPDSSGIKLPGVVYSAPSNASGIKLPELKRNNLHNAALGLLNPLLDVVATVFPYAATAVKVIGLAGSLFGRKPEEFQTRKNIFNIDGEEYGTITFVPADGGATKKLQFDLVLSEEPKRTATPFTHPVEDGTEISDYVLVENRVVTAILLMSNYSISRAVDEFAKEEETRSMIGRIVDAINPMPSDPKLFMTKNQEPEKIAEKMYNSLEKVMEEKIVCTFQSSIKRYDDLVITELHTTRDKDTGDALKIYITFQEIKQARGEDILVDILITPQEVKLNKSAMNSMKNVGAQIVGDF